jgi:hypothetical protein
VRLRDQPLTRKPRITIALGGLLWVERLDPAMWPEVELADNITEAIDIALNWAGPKDT